VSELNAALAPDAPGNMRAKVEASALKAYISAALVPPELSGLKAILPQDTPNLGLLIRWHMALWNIKRYHDISEPQRHTLESQWMTETKAMIADLALPTVGVAEDDAHATCDGDAEPPMRQEGTKKCQQQAGMLPDATILLLDLKRPGAEAGSFQRLTLSEMKRIHNLMARDLSTCAGPPAAKNPLWSLRCFLAQPVALSSEYVIIRAAVDAPLVIRMHAGTDLEEIKREDAEWVGKLNLILCNWSALPA